MHSKQDVLKSKRGNITPIFCMLVFVLLGGISYSIYVGQMVTDRIAEQTAADAAALSSANHIAQGLNMISANNLSIGAAVQVAGSLSNLALYLGTVRALMITADELPTATGLGGPSPAQRVVYDNMANISMPFLQTASGLTRLNRSIYDYWQFMTPLRALEVARVNVPGSLVVSVPRIAFENESSEDLRIYKYSGMRTTLPENVICRAYKATDIDGPSGIVQMTTWLSAPFASLTNGSAGAFGSVLSVITAVDDVLHAFPFPLRVDVVRGGSNCGINLKLTFSMGIPVPRSLQRIGWPSVFGGFSETKEYNIVSHGMQAKYFADQNTNTKENFGFLVPEKIGQDDAPSKFERSIEYAQLLTSPLRSARQVNPGNCPSEWKRGSVCDGVGLVSMMDESQKQRVRNPNANGENDAWMDSAEVNHEVNLGSGGLHKVLRAGGEMEGSLSRLKFRLSQAKAVFRPHGNAGSAAGNMTRDKQHQTTFWPGWQSTLTHATLLSAILGKITDITGLDQFAKK